METAQPWTSEPAGGRKNLSMLIFQEITLPEAPEHLHGKKFVNKGIADN